MKKNMLLTMGIIIALSLSGCQKNTSDAETEALKEQITELQQQITELQQNQQEPAASNEISPEAPSDQAPATENPTSQEPPATSEQSPATQETVPQADTSTTHTMGELTTLVNDFTDKADAATPSGSNSEDMNQFFTLKQEEKQIDDALDRHENELEYLYRQNTITRDEYKSKERELERLEDQLDAAEDRLEITFGIDD